MRREPSSPSRVRAFLGPLAQRPSPTAGAAAVASSGALWAALCLVLAAGGHEPAVTLVPIPRADYYAAQALFVVPVLLALWTLCAAVAYRLARALGGTGSFGGTANAIGIALALPLAVLFLVPDFVAYGLAGFDALGLVVRVTAPLSFAATLWLATIAVGVACSVTGWRAFVAAAAGGIAQALVGGILLR